MNNIPDIPNLYYIYCYTFKMLLCKFCYVCYPSWHLITLPSWYCDKDQLFNIIFILTNCYCLYNILINYITLIYNAYIIISFIIHLKNTVNIVNKNVYLIIIFNNWLKEFFFNTNQSWITIINCLKSMEFVY